MDEKVSKLVMIHRMTQSYYDLSLEEQQQLQSQIDQSRADVGATLASPVYDCMWSNERVRQFYIVEYPNMNALFEQMDCLEKIPYAKYFQASFLVGKAQELANLPFTPRNAVAKLLLIRGYEDAYYRLTDAQRDEIWGQLNANLQKVGGRTQPYWYNCTGTSGVYESFGIMEYPDVQALVEEISLSDKAGLFQYLHTEVVLGTERK